MKNTRTCNVTLCDVWKHTKGNKMYRSARIVTEPWHLKFCLDVFITTNAFQAFSELSDTTTPKGANSAREIQLTFSWLLRVLMQNMQMH
eukprot:5412121-Pleurochrysis_carterae.AAC.3